MEIEKLIPALEETVTLLRASRSSDWSSISVDEIVAELESIVIRAKDSQVIDAARLGFLFAPTGAMQDTAIDNGWDDEYLRIAETIDQLIAGN